MSRTVHDATDPAVRPPSGDGRRAGSNLLLCVCGGDGAVHLLVRAQPGAKVSRIVGPHGDRLKIALAAPPTDGRANAELLRFVAEWLDLPMRAVTLGSGHSSRDKRVDLAARLEWVLERARRCLESVGPPSASPQALLFPSTRS